MYVHTYRRYPLYFVSFYRISRTGYNTAVVIGFRVVSPPVWMGGFCFFIAFLQFSFYDCDPVSSSY